ncbi:M20 family metallopeptidase [Halorientalis litorea]|uniref:M20 family metallopeptidase n=1 Tax=Halorientalis litorea TaxID=2931977 RepID=UPI001FF46EB7|nr:M20 family metallopeptidase [Halorientalis litorea]
MFETLSFHERAVRTPSHEDVTAMRELLVETLADHGADPRVDDAGNTLAVREGDGDGPHLVLNTHIDTVPPHVPHERRASPPGVEAGPSDTAGQDGGDVVCGRGACDAKGPLAALLAAFFDADVDRGRLTLAVTPDEEVYSTGAAALSLAADGYIVGEPTGLDACTAAKGRFEGTVTIEGVAAHAAEPGSGANAIRAAAPVLQAIESYDETVGPPEHDALGRPTLEPTVIEGGEATNQIPAACRITVDRRSVPPETQQGFAEQFEAHLDGWLPDSMSLSFAYTERETPFLEAFATPADSDVVQALLGAGAGNVRPFGAATEASYFAADAPTVVFGPGVLADEAGAVAHAEREYVRRSQIERAGDIVTGAVESLLS